MSSDWRYERKVSWCLVRPSVLLLQTLDRLDSVYISSPCSACESIRHVPKQHRSRSIFRILTSIQDNPEASIDRLTPPCTASVVKGNPSSPSHSITYYVLNSHVSCDSRPIIYVRGFSQWRVSPTHIMMISSNDYRVFNSTISYCFVHLDCTLNSPLSIWIQDSCLWTNGHLVLFSIFNPFNVGVDLILDVLRGVF